MFENQQYIFYGFAILTGLFITSWLASVLYYLMAGYNPAAAMPWSIWAFVPYAHIPDIQSRLFVAAGFPVMLAIATMAKLLNREEPAGADSRWASQDRRV